MKSILRRYIPQQHGAWAMLLVPYLAGLLLAPRYSLGLPILLIAWLAAYCASYYFFQAVKSRRFYRYRRQLLSYGIVALLTASATVFTAPVVAVVAPVFAVGVAVNSWFAWRRNERAFVNGVVAVFQSCVIFPAVLLVAQMPLDELKSIGVVNSLYILVGYFCGTVLVVKTVIRERKNVSYRWASWFFHSGITALSVILAWCSGLSWWTCCLFLWLTLRSIFVAGRAIRPAYMGVLETINSVLIIVAIAVIVH